MKRETLVTAIVFLCVGFLAGYITKAQMNAGTAQGPRIVTATSSGMSGAANSAGATMASLPEGHPPINAATAAGGVTAPPALPQGHPPIDRAAILARLEEAAAKSPNSPDACLQLADFLYDQKEYGKAIEWYQRGLAVAPKNVDARTDLGTALFYSGRAQDALHEYAKSLAIDPTHQPTLLNSIVVNLEGTHDVAAAQKAWERLQQVNPNNPALAGLRQQIDSARAARP